MPESFDAASFPPLLRGTPAPAGADVLADAAARARAGTDPGLIVYRIRPDHLSAAVVLAPEVPLADAMAMVLAAANAFGDSFGALAPSEVAAQFDWPGGIRINGARCGGLRAAASATGDTAEPDWLVLALDVPFFAAADAEPGETPDSTTLWEEGCAEITPQRLLESWSRHLLVWINEWSENGIARLHRDWLGRAWGVGQDIAAPPVPGGVPGRFTGLDERGGLILNSGGTARGYPLTLMLEEV